MAKKTAILAVRIIGDSKGVVKEFASAESQVGKFDRALGFVKKGLAVGVVGAAGLAATAIKKGFSRLKNIENARKALEGIGLAGKEIDAIYNDALKAVDGTAYGVDQAMKAAAPALASGVKAGEDLTKWLTLISDATAQSETDFDSMARMMNKVNGVGKLTGGTIQQMAENGLQVVPILEKSLGKSTEEIYKMASAGEISADMFRKALEEGIGGAAIKAADTVDGAWSQMWSSVSRIGGNLIEKLYPKLGDGMRGLTGYLKEFEPIAKAAGEKLGEWADQYGPPVIAFIEDLIGKISTVVQTLWDWRTEIGILVGGFIAWKTYLAAANAVSWAQYLWASKDVLIKATQIALTNGLAAAQRLLNLAMSMNPIGLIIAAVTLLIVGFVALYKRSETFRNIVQSVGDWGKKALGWIVEKATDLWNRFKNLIDRLGGFKNILKTAFDYTPLGAFINGAKSLYDWIKKVVDWVKKIKFPKAPEWMSKVGSFAGDLFGSRPPAGGVGAAWARVPTATAPPGSLFAASPSFTTRRVGGSGDSAGVTIIINGAIDPVSTAKQIEKILKRGKGAGV